MLKFKSLGKKIFLVILFVAFIIPLIPCEPVIHISLGSSSTRSVYVPLMGGIRFTGELRWMDFNGYAFTSIIFIVEYLFKKLIMIIVSSA